MNAKPNPTSTTPKPARVARVREGVARHSVAWLLGALVVLIVSAPFVQQLDGGRAIEAVLLTVVLTAAVLAVGGRKKTLLLAIVLATPVLVGRWLHHFQPGPATYEIFAGAFLIFNGFVVYQFLRFILLSPRVNSEVLCAAVSAYLLLSVLWAAAYTLVARVSPGSISGLSGGSTQMQGFEVLYFSLITLTTVGYGDMVPVSNVARMLAMLEAATGTMYMAVLVARLVAVYTTEDHTAKPDVK